MRAPGPPWAVDLRLMSRRASTSRRISSWEGCIGCWGRWPRKTAEKGLRRRCGGRGRLQRRCGGGRDGVGRRGGGSGRAGTRCVGEQSQVQTTARPRQPDFHGVCVCFFLLALTRFGTATNYRTSSTSSKSVSLASLSIKAGTCSLP